MTARYLSRSEIDPAAIFCVGKNYPDHAREMLAWEQDTRQYASSEADDEPVIFMKPGTALSRNDRTSIPLFRDRPASDNMHHEVELVLLIGSDANCVDIDEASSRIAGYGVGLDMTLRDVQLDAKKSGNPWLKSKGFRNSALVSDFITTDTAGPWEELSISLRVNGHLVQHSPVSRMTFSPAFLVHYLSYIYGLRKGDLVFTGTPSGVGKVNPSDRLDAVLESGTGREHAPTTLVTFEATVI